MPINLTLSDGSGMHRSGRRRRHKARNHFIAAVLGGLALLIVLGVVLYMSNPNIFGSRIDPSLAHGKPSTMMPADPVPIEKSSAPGTANSVSAVSSDDASQKDRFGRIIALKRVQGGESTDLQIEYEFLKGALTPDNYYIAIQTPDGRGYTAFDIKAAKRDVVQVSLELKKLSGRGPIAVWIETRIGSERISNVMTLP